MTIYSFIATEYLFKVVMKAMKVNKDIFHDHLQLYCYRAFISIYVSAFIKVVMKAMKAMKVNKDIFPK